jgi:hypothetical protein
MSIFDDKPERRPKSLGEWMRLLRDAGTTVAPTTTGPSGREAGGLGVGTGSPGWPTTELLPNPPSRSPRRRGRLLLAALVGALVVAGGGAYLGAKMTHTASPPESFGPPTAPLPTPSTPTLPGPTRNNAVGPNGEPIAEAGVTVRHSGNITMTLDGNQLDLDSPARDPQWDTGSRDMLYGSYKTSTLLAYSPSIYLQKKKADYDTCRETTGYKGNVSYESPNFNVGDYFCVKTDENRYSAVKIIELTDDKLTVNAVTYDPPDEK